MKFSFISLFFLLSICSIAQIKTPEASPSATISEVVGLSNVSVSYSRPAVKGRVIFGDLVPYGKVWRTGANKITSIKFDNDLYINGALLKAGSYGLYTIPRVGSWTIIFNRDDKQWGAYEYDITKDVIRFEVQPIEMEHLTQYLTIDFDDLTPTTANLSIKWENTNVKFSIEDRVHDKIMAEIKEKTAKADVNTSTLMSAADYYYKNNIDLPQALEWAKKVVEKDKQYWTYQLVARIAAKLGKCEIALPNAEQSMKMAKEAGDDSYIKMNEAVFATCKK